MNPLLSIRTLVVDGDVVAAELGEELTVDGERRAMAIAAFFHSRAGKIAVAKL